MTERLIIISVLLLFFASFAAASNPASSTTGSHSLKEGSRALQFQIGSNFQLSHFQGNVISYKRHRTDQSAWRIGLSLEGIIRSTESERDDFTPDQESTYNNDQERTDRGLSVTIRPQLQQYLHADHTIRPYLSYGALTGYSYQFGEIKSFAGENMSTEISTASENTQHQFRVGATVNFGVEWFATSSISFLAEYGVDLYYSYRNQEQIGKIFSPDGSLHRRVDQSSRVSEFHLDPLSVRFGLSAYF